MSSAHLAAGSEEPPRVEGLLRLYSMVFCPYAQRPRLVLNAKGIPYDIVNINLVSKPEWYFKIHPQGKVPALLDGDKIVIESLDICDYLDEKYPEHPLYPAEPAAKQKDKELIANIDAIISLFNKALYTPDAKSPREWLDAFLEALQVFEDELSKRGSVFFGGDKPGMVDYMLWPWAERAGCVSMKVGQQLPVDKSNVPLVRQWKKAMREHPVVDEIYTGVHRFWEVIQAKINGTSIDYDTV